MYQQEAWDIILTKIDWLYSQLTHRIDSNHASAAKINIVSNDKSTTLDDCTLPVHTTSEAKWSLYPQYIQLTIHIVQEIDFSIERNHPSANDFPDSSPFLKIGWWRSSNTKALHQSIINH